MEKNIERDDYLDYLDEAFERRRNFRGVSLDHRSLMIRRVACLNGRFHAVDRANGSARLPCLYRELSLGPDS